MLSCTDYAKIGIAAGFCALGPCLSGCQIALAGEGSLEVGMRNDNFLVLRHRAIPATPEQKSESSLDFDSDFLDRLGLVKPEANGDPDDVPTADSPHDPG